MIRLSIQDLLKDSLHNKRLVLSDIEAELPTPSYTYRTLKKLQIKLTVKDTNAAWSKTISDTTIVDDFTLISPDRPQQKRKEHLKVILGSDMYQTIHSWYKFEALSKEFGFIVVDRKELPCQILNNDIQLANSGQVIYLSNPHWNYSSRDIRQTIKEYVISQNDKKHEEIKQYLPEKVFDYILMHQLYC